MHPRRMTVTELEEHYMQGEFKPQSNMTVLHPRHMTDTELIKELDENQVANYDDYSSRAKAVLDEFMVRMEALNKKENK